MRLDLVEHGPPSDRITAQQFGQISGPTEKREGQIAGLGSQAFGCVHALGLIDDEKTGAGHDQRLEATRQRHLQDTGQSQVKLHQPFAWNRFDAWRVIDAVSHDHIKIMVETIKVVRAVTFRAVYGDTGTLQVALHIFTDEFTVADAPNVREKIFDALRWMGANERLPVDSQPFILSTHVPSLSTGSVDHTNFGLSQPLLPHCCSRLPSIPPS